MSSQGSRLKKIRKAIGLSQEAFGAIFDIKKQFVSNLENNHVFLNNDKLVKLLCDYRVNLNYLLGGIGEPFIKDIPKFDDVRAEIMSEVQEMLKEKGII